MEKHLLKSVSAICNIMLKAFLYIIQAMTVWPKFYKDTVYIWGEIFKSLFLLWCYICSDTKYIPDGLLDWEYCTCFLLKFVTE